MLPYKSFCLRRHFFMSSQSISIPEKGFLRLRQVLQLIPLGRTRWYEGVQNGEFPAPVKFGRCAFYRASDIAELITRIEGGENGNPAN